MGLKERKKTARRERRAVESMLEAETI